MQRFYEVNGMDIEQVEASCACEPQCGSQAQGEGLCGYNLRLHALRRR